MITTKLVIPTYIDKKEIQTEGVSIVTMAITPEIAAFWLKTYNSSNRPLSSVHVSFLSSQISNNKWIEMNGTVISFNTEGQLNDGQHRLAAIVESKRPLKYMVAVGVPNESFHVMDTGKTRGGSDALSISGYKNTGITASICKFAINYKAGKYGNMAASASGRNKTKVTNSDILDFANNNKKHLLSVVHSAMNYYNAGDKIVTKTLLGGLLYLFSEVDSKLAERFIFKLATGSDIPYKSVLYLLRNRLKIAKISDTKKIPISIQVAFIIKTWNSIREAKNLKVLKYTPSSGEKFPKIV